LVTEDHPIARHGLVQLLEGTDDFVVVGETATGEGALQLVADASSDPDVLLVDLRLPGIDGLETTRRLARVSPDTRVVILTAFEDARAMVAAVRAGAKAYMLKSAEGDEIVETIRMVAQGHVVFTSEVWDAVSEIDPQTESGAIRLTRRESEVLSLLSQARSNREIADELGVSIETVKTHLERLYDRLGAVDRTDAVAKGLRAGLID
jgi:DNA-binding NarL/FixJ family response regulator